MITEVKTYYYDMGIPDDEVLSEALHIAKTSHCIVKLEYEGYGHSYSIKIYDNDNLTNIQCRMSNIQCRMPRYYGL